MAALKASLVKRIERLEEKIPAPKPELPPFDLRLLVESEDAYFSKVMVLLRTKARELGYGDKNNKLNWFDLQGCDPLFNREVEEECVLALNDEERKIIDTFSKVVDKGLRLTANLSEEEKAVIRKYNEVVMFFGNSMMMNAAKQGWSEGHTQEELDELRGRYEQIMQKYGEAIYE